MKPRNLLRLMAGGLDTIIRLLSWVGIGVTGIMTLLVVGNVAGRFLLNKPLLGTVELVELIMVIIVFFAMPYTAVYRGHITVDLVISRLSRRTQAIMGSIVSFLSTVIVGLITYQSTVFAISYAQNLRQTTEILSIPLAPFKFVLVLGYLLFCLTLLIQVFQSLPPEERQQGDLSK